LSQFFDAAFGRRTERDITPGLQTTGGEGGSMERGVSMGGGKSTAVVVQL